MTQAAPATPEASPVPAIDPGRAAALLRRYRIEIFLATWSSYFGFYVVRKVYAVLKGPLKERFGWDDVTVAMPWTIYLVCYMLGQFVAAVLGRRYASRRILLAGMVVAAACNLALGWLVDAKLADAYLWICLTMALQGFAQATGWAHNVGLFANWTRRTERGTLFGIWATCYQVGAVAGKALAAFLLGALGMAWSFTGASLVLLAICVLFAFTARERPSDHGLQLDDEAADAAADSDASAQVGERTAAASRWLGLVVAMGAIYFGLKFLRYALDSWSALILAEQFHVSAEVAGYLSAAFDLVGFLGVIVGGIWSDRIPGARRAPVVFWMVAACLLATIGIAVVGRDSLVLFVVLLGLIGFTSMGPDSLVSGACAMDCGSRRQAAQAAGIINGLGSLGPIAQEPVIGWLKQYHGVGAVLLLLVMVVLATTLGSAGLWRMERRG